ncbi:MAG TPA: stalk domain-containing protein [Syntrophomonadaceae bacterium]|nr:stalk domain-containing protein [Syntrophomonadaceae bacterium]
MKRVAVILFLSLTLIASMACFVSAAEGPPVVVVNGQQLSLDVAPVIENDRILVPLRAIFDALSVPVEWDSPTQTVTATKGRDHLILTIGSASAYKNGQAMTLDTPASLVNDRTMVPLRFVSEALNAKVAWDEDTQTATVTSQAGGSASTNDPEASYDSGMSYVHTGNYPKAVDAFSQYITLSEKSSNVKTDLLADAYFQRGHLYSLLDYNNMAINDYEAAITLKPDTAIYYDYYAASYLKQGDSQTALDNFQEAGSLGYIPRQVEYYNDENIKSAALSGLNLYKKLGSKGDDTHLSAELRYLLPLSNASTSPFKKVWTHYDQATNTIYAGLFLEGMNFDAYAHADMSLAEDFDIAINSLKQYHPGAKACGWVQLEETIADPNNPPNHGVEATYRQGDGNAWIMEFVIVYFGENSEGILGIYREAVG